MTFALIINSCAAGQYTYVTHLPEMHACNLQLKTSFLKDKENACKLPYASVLVLFCDFLLPRPENGPGTQAGKERVLYYLQAHARNELIILHEMPGEHLCYQHKLISKESNSSGCDAISFNFASNFIRNIA